MPEEIKPTIISRSVSTVATPEEEHRETFGERSEEDILAKAPVELTVGGSKYELKPLPMKRSSAWRKQIGEFGAGLIIPVLSLMGVINKIQGPEAVDLGDGSILADPMLQLLDAPDLLFDLTALYCGWEGEERARMEDTITDRECIALFQEACNLSLFPFVHPFTRIAKMA